jgi:hypothetical protein
VKIFSRSNAEFDKKFILLALKETFEAVKNQS